ncbi:MAG: hypothetical protein ACOX88_07560 [Christensenellales bacterium]|jgi:hypothetical protein
MQVWIMLRKKSKIVKDTLAEMDENLEFDAAVSGCLESVCRLWDIPRPMVLSRHASDFDQFGRALFMPDHFVESFPYDALEVEAVIERKQVDDYI